MIWLLSIFSFPFYFLFFKICLVYILVLVFKRIGALYEYKSGFFGTLC